VKLIHLVPTNGDSDFYEVLLSIERVAAAQLGVELEAVYCGGSRATVVEAGAAVARRTPRPDCVLLPNFHGAAHELLPALDAAGIATFLLNEGMTLTDRLAHGEPRAKHPRWLGELVPDDVAAGRQLAELLVDQARARGLAKDGKIHVGVLAGTQTFAGQTRFQGWVALQKKRPEVIQASVQYAKWARDVARGAAEVMLRRRPEIAVVWAANDAMALGAVEAAEACGRKAGRDLLVGGIDLLPEALQRVDDGSMAVSLGGHTLDGARAVILLHDHFQGKDFAPFTRESQLEPVTAASARAYRRFFETRAWERVDFAKYSRVRSGSANPPDLTIQTLL
jgi:ABC-type sugar transport system substrate-binding protein